ncbi:RNA recognition motif protein (macronuclear) [Tetrahymena thermophila SB210]|uniref:RNA recognition motif protein n=1 Tax=Tetrahymena thermophila (strain SB210) TaxID=312017 RepID=I7LW96_TETTS|nr:RNA recognition motif protein [Tetrahymena thermophila SB210]EAS01210.2 RNA recognition motif protein [Tetrahymena thermophila SB210]|eukprot:XP_001021455.2 RNA recognition motif protein [Tetrahymena thermophila SB210]
MYFNLFKLYLLTLSNFLFLQNELLVFLLKKAYRHIVLQDIYYLLFNSNKDISISQSIKYNQLILKTFLQSKFVELDSQLYINRIDQKQMSSSRERKRSDSRSKKDKKDKKDKKEKKDKKDKKEHKEHKERRDSREKKSKKESKDRRDRKESRDREEKKDKKDKKDKKKRDKSEDRKRRSNSYHQKRKRSSTKSSSRGRKRSQPQRGQNFGFAFDSPPKEITQKEEPAQSQEVVNDFSNVINNPNFNPKFKELFMKLQNSKLPDLQNSKCDRKLYIGNIPPGLQPVKCQLMINSALKQLKVNQETPGDSCVSIWISPEGNYGFAEFRTPDEATKALNALVNVTLLGQPLKVGRPAQYTKSSTEVSSSGANSGATGFSSSGRFDILSLLDPNGQKKDQEEAEGAQQAANLTLIPGLEAAPPVTNKNMISLKVQIPTRILVLHNMIADGELIIDEEFRQIEEDVKEECSKHGKVVKITIPRPSDSNEQVKGQGRIFVEYENTDAARDARRDLNGRLFNNRTVQVQYFSEQKYLDGELDFRIR